MNIDFIDGELSITDENGVMFLIQPEWPDGTPWASEAEARAWAELVIAWMADPEASEPPGGPA